MAQRGARAVWQGVEAIQAAEGGDARTNQQLSPVELKLMHARMARAVYLRQRRQWGEGH